MTESASPARGATSSSSLISASLRLNSSSAWMDTANLLVFVFGGQQYPQLVKPAAGRGLHGGLGFLPGVEQHQGRPQEPGRRRPDEFGELRLPARRSTQHSSHDTVNAAGASEVPVTFPAGVAGVAGVAGLRRKPS